MSLPGDFLNVIKTVIKGESDAPSQLLNEESSFLEKDLDRELKMEDVKTRKESNELLKQNRTERKKYAHHIFLLTCIWTTLIFLILVANGLKSINNMKYFTFEISDKVLFSLINLHNN